MVNIESFSGIVKKDVFTHTGSYVGRVSDLEFDMSKFRVRAVIVETAKGSSYAELVGGKKSLLVPFNIVQAIGDVVIIKHVVPHMPDETLNPKSDEENVGINF